MTTNSTTDLSLAEEIPVVDMVPPVVGRCFEKVPADLRGLTEEEVEAKLLKRDYTPSLTDNRLRLGFWAEYERAINHGGKMVIENVIRGKCSRRHFYEVILKDYRRVAWLTTPPVEYKMSLEEALHAGVRKLREILDFPLYKDGNPDTKAADIILRTVAMLDVRVKGAITQRMDVRSLSVSVDAKAKEAAQIAPLDSIESIDAKIRALEAKVSSPVQLDKTYEIKEEEKVTIELDATGFTRGN
jgi:hypothetical protein